MRKLRKDDEVKVISGKDKGKTGKILSVQSHHCVVEGVNEATKAVKPNQNTKGGLNKINLPIHISNLLLIEGKDSGRVGFVIKSGKKNRQVKK